MPYIKATPAIQAWQKGLKSDVENLKDFQLSNLIAKIPDERTGTTTYDINGPYIASKLGSLLNVIDPMGLGNFTPGMVAQAPLKGAGWTPELVQKFKRVGDLVEGEFGRIKAASEFTPFFPWRALPEHPTWMGGHYGARLPDYPYGAIMAYGPKNDPWQVIPHELLHRLWDVDVGAKSLSEYLYKTANPYYRDILSSSALKPSHKADEYMAYIVDNLIREPFGAKLSPFVEAMPKMQEKAIQEWLRTKKLLKDFIKAQ